MSSGGVDEGAGSGGGGDSQPLPKPKSTLSSSEESNKANELSATAVRLMAMAGTPVGVSSVSISSSEDLLEDISSNTDEDDFGSDGGGGDVNEGDGVDGVGASGGSNDDPEFESTSIAGSSVEKLVASSMDKENDDSGGTPPKRSEADVNLEEIREAVSLLVENVEKLLEDNCEDTSGHPVDSDATPIMEVEVEVSIPAPEITTSTTNEADTADIARDENGGTSVVEKSSAETPSTIEAGPDVTSRMEVDIEDDFVGISPSPSTATAGGNEEGTRSSGISTVVEPSSSSEACHDPDMTSSSSMGLVNSTAAKANVEIASDDSAVGLVISSEDVVKGTGDGLSGIRISVWSPQSPSKVNSGVVASAVEDGHPTTASGPVAPSQNDDNSPAFNAKWEKITVAPAPLPRHGHRAISFGASWMLVFGGGTSHQGITGMLHVYDTIKNEWFQPEMTGEIPLGLAAFGMALDGSRLLVHGGMLEDSSLSNALYQLIIPTWEWRRLNPLVIGEVPCARLGHSFTLVWDKVILFGGLANDGDDYFLNGSKFMNDLHILHVRENNENGFWNQPMTFGKPPTPRESHTAVAYRSHWGMINKLFVYGGTGRGGRFGDVHILHVETMSWSKPELGGVHPAPRSLHSATLVGNKMYVFGGFISTVDQHQQDGARVAGKCSNSMACLDIDTLAWEKVCQDTSTTPAARAGHSATLVNTSIYVWSGRDGLRLTPGHGGQVCFSDLWKLEVQLPAAPTRLRQVLSEDMSSIKIRWEGVPGANSYLVQVAPVKDELSPPSITNAQGGMSIESIQHALHASRLIAAGYTPCPPRMTSLPAHYSWPSQSSSEPPMKKVAFGPPTQLSASPYIAPVGNGGVANSSRDGDGSVWTSSRPLGVPVPAWDPTSAGLRGMQVLMNRAAANQLTMPINFARPSQFPINPGLGGVNMAQQFYRGPSIIRQPTGLTTNQQRFQMGQFRLVQDYNTRQGNYNMVPRTNGTGTPSSGKMNMWPPSEASAISAAGPRQPPPPNRYLLIRKPSAAPQANPPVQIIQQRDMPPLQARPVIPPDGLATGAEEGRPTTVSRIRMTMDEIARAIRHVGQAEGGGDPSDNNDKGSGTGQSE